MRRDGEQRSLVQRASEVDRSQYGFKDYANGRTGGRMMRRRMVNTLAFITTSLLIGSVSLAARYGRQRWARGTAGAYFVGRNGGRAGRLAGGDRCAGDADLDSMEIARLHLASVSNSVDTALSWKRLCNGVIGNF